MPVLRGLSNPNAENGGVAQLGERLNGIQEASGSIPLISTIIQKGKTIASSSLFIIEYGLADAPVINLLLPF